MWTVTSGVDVPVPMQPLLDYWTRRHPEHQRSGCVCTRGGVCASIECLAAAVRTSRSTMFRRLGEKQITMGEADQWACALGEHPNRIWPGWDRQPVTAALQTRHRPEGLF